MWLVLLLWHQFHPWSGELTHAVGMAKNKQLKNETFRIKKKKGMSYYKTIARLVGRMQDGVQSSML